MRFEGSSFASSSSNFLSESENWARDETHHKAINFDPGVGQFGFFLLHLLEARSQTAWMRKKSTKRVHSVA